MNDTSPRLAIVVSHPIQYYAPWFRQLQAAGLALRVFYLWDFGVADRHDPGFGRAITWDIDLLGGYDHEFVPNRARTPGTDRFAGLYNPDLPARLRQWRPDAILIFGYKYRTHLTLILRQAFRGTPLLFRGDSHLLGRPQLPAWKRWPLTLLFRRFSAFLYVGQANRAYLEALGVPAHKLFFSPHCVDGEHFRATDTDRRSTAEIRRELDLGERRVVLFAGKLVAAKQPRELMAAFLATVANGDRWALVYVGDGPEKAELVAAARRTGACIRFLPFANQSEMPARYRLADLFVLPSRGVYETWGLAVNEAMHLGVPCLVTDRVGCQMDLVTDGATGWVAHADDPASLPAKLIEACQAVAADPSRWSAAARARIAGYTYAAATAGLRAALTRIAQTQ